MIDIRIIACIATCAVTFVAVFLWKVIRKRMWGELVTLRIDPDDVRSEVIAGYFKEIAISLDERPRNLRLILDGRNVEGKKIALDFTSKGGMEILAGDDKKRFSLRSRWIPDHSLPLEFSSKPKTLFVKAVDSNRFRVMSDCPFCERGWIAPLLCLIMTAGAFTANFELIVFALTVLISIYALKPRS
jgi:hypothetical protein